MDSLGVALTKPGTTSEAALLWRKPFKLAECRSCMEGRGTALSSRLPGGLQNTNSASVPLAYVGLLELHLCLTEFQVLVAMVMTTHRGGRAAYATGSNFVAEPHLNLSLKISCS